MSKTLTLRLTEENYDKIAQSAKLDHRPISNFITHIVLNKIDDDYYCSDEEMEEINANKSLMKDLGKAKKDIKQMKGSFVK